MINSRLGTLVFVLGLLKSVRMFQIMGESTAVASANETWHYKTDNGRANWTEGDCSNGLHQSPIDLNINQSTVTCEMDELNLESYKTPISQANIQNNGKTVQITLNVTRKVNINSGGLPAAYELLQMHIHFAQINQKGSEHTINATAYPVEVHFVHKKEGSPDPTEEKGGLAVLAVLFELTPTETNATRKIQQFVDKLEAEKVPNKSNPISVKMSYWDLLPVEHATFYRYNGSLTTPGCNEVVIWTVFNETAKISQKQMDQLRTIESSEPDKKVNNYRPTQPLNERQVLFRQSCESPSKITDPPPVTSPEETDNETAPPQNDFAQKNRLSLGLAAVFIILHL